MESSRRNRKIVDPTSLFGCLWHQKQPEGSSTGHYSQALMADERLFNSHVHSYSNSEPVRVSELTSQILWPERLATDIGGQRHTLSAATSVYWRSYTTIWPSKLPRRGIDVPYRNMTVCEPTFLYEPVRILHTTWHGRATSWQPGLKYHGPVWLLSVLYLSGRPINRTQSYRETQLLMPESGPAVRNHNVLCRTQISREIHHLIAIS